MNLLNLAITFTLVILCANLFFLFAPPAPAPSFAALGGGLLLGLGLSRFVVLPALAEYTAQ